MGDPMMSLEKDDTVLASSNGPVVLIQLPYQIPA